MTPRIDATNYIKSGLGKAMLALQREVETSGLEHSLMELVKIRASQINGCAYCLDMHTKDARALGETEQRIYALSAWREAPFYTDAQRAAFELAETMTRQADRGEVVSDELWTELTKYYEEKQLAGLVFWIATVNFYNRINAAVQTPAGAKWN